MASAASSAVRPALSMSSPSWPISITNSSPPSRATVSPGRCKSSRRCATCLSMMSPTAWPRASLICLKLSRSTNSKAPICPDLRAPATACSVRSSSMRRLGNCVSASKYARWCERASACLRSVMSRDSAMKRWIDALGPDFLAIESSNQYGRPCRLNANWCPAEYPVALAACSVARQPATASGATMSCSRWPSKLSATSASSARWPLRQ